MSTDSATADAARGLAGLAKRLAFAVLALLASHAWAAGTPAGTQIPNTAQISYRYNGTRFAQEAAAPYLTVAKLLWVKTVWQDSTPVTANSPDSLRPLTFAVTNLGNGTDTFALSRDDAIAGDQFDPLAAPAGAIWLETGAQAGLQTSGPNADVAYVAGANDLVVAPGAARTVYLASNIPSALATGAIGRSGLQVRSVNAPPSATPGAQVAVQNGVPVIAGPEGARSTSTGAYLVSVVAIGILKSVVGVVDTQGGARVMPGSVITYRIVVSATGTGAASNVVVSDPLPAALAYVPASITVDGVARTDAGDGDDSSFTGGTVRTVLPSLPASQSRSIEFKATVN